MRSEMVSANASACHRLLDQKRDTLAKRHGDLGGQASSEWELHAKVGHPAVPGEPRRKKKGRVRERGLLFYY